MFSVQLEVCKTNQSTKTNQNKTTHLKPPQNLKRNPTNPSLQHKTKKKKPDPPTCYLGEVQDMCGQYKDKFTSKLL